MIDRNKYLTEAMGECWHNFTPSEGYYCIRCDKKITDYKQSYDFSTWAGFGKLFDWAHDQIEWWIDFTCDVVGRRDDIVEDENFEFYMIHAEFINPDRFANAVYEFLKGREA